jgi:hypothetical protein
MRAPAIVRSNTNSTTKDNIFVYWCSPAGEIQPAADTRITEAQLRRMPQYQHWRRCEAVGAREIEKVSLIMSRQMWEKKKAEKVQQHLREKFELDQLAIRCKLRIAGGFSKNDEEMNKRILQRAQRSEDALMALIASEFSPATRTTSLQMEAKTQSTSPVANLGQKQEGIALV